MIRHAPEDSSTQIANGSLSGLTVSIRSSDARLERSPDDAWMAGTFCQSSQADQMLPEEFPINFCNDLSFFAEGLVLSAESYIVAKGNAKFTFTGKNEIRVLRGSHLGLLYP